MKQYKFTGLFINNEGQEYTLEVYCNSFIQALILLTADAIRLGRFYQLNNITDEKGSTFMIDDINKLSEFFYK